MKKIRSEKINSADFNDYFNHKMQDPEFRKAWEEFQPEYEIMKVIAEARARNNLTQKQLSELSGINQSEISKLENGTRNPSINLLKKLAHAMNSKLRIEFVPDEMQ